MKRDGLRRQPRFCPARRSVHTFDQGTKHDRHGHGYLARCFSGARRGHEALAISSCSPYINDMYTPIQNMSELAVQFMESLVSGERVLELVQTAPRIKDRRDATNAPVFRGELRFEDVVFGYEPSKRVLNGFRLHVTPGETVAIVGGSGAANLRY